MINLYFKNDLYHFEMGTLLFEEHDQTQELVYVSSLGQGAGAVVGDEAKGKQKFR
jgi:hypothetical protein